MKNDKIGIAVITLLLVAIVMVAVGSGAYYVYIKDTKRTSTEIKTSQESNIAVIPTKNEAATPETSTPTTATIETTVTKEGPGGLSVKVPKTIAQYLTEETRTYPESTELILYLGGENYFKSINLSPNGAEFWITIAEEEYDESTHCGSNAFFFDVISKKSYIINGYSFTQVNERGERDSGNIIRIFNKTNKNTCRYVSIATESVTEDLIRALAAEQPNNAGLDIDLNVKNTNASRIYFNKLGEEIAKTVSAK